MKTLRDSIIDAIADATGVSVEAVRYMVVGGWVNDIKEAMCSNNRRPGEVPFEELEVLTTVEDMVDTTLHAVVMLIKKNMLVLDVKYVLDGLSPPLHKSGKYLVNTWLEALIVPIVMDYLHIENSLVYNIEHTWVHNNGVWWKIETHTWKNGGDTIRGVRSLCVAHRLEAPDSVEQI